jgi:uncharacterized protein HemY
MDEAGPTTSLQLRLAQAAWQSGDVPRARRVVDEALAAEPANVELLQFKRRLPPS